MLSRLLFLLWLFTFVGSFLFAADDQSKQEVGTNIQLLLAQSSKLKPGTITLEELVKELREKYAFPIVLSRDSLEAEGISVRTPVKLPDVPVSLQSHLNLMLHPLQLAWFIENESLAITTEREERTKLISKRYNVKKLIAKDARGVLDYKPLESLVRRLYPETWSVTGGAGSVKAVNGHLVVVNTGKVQATVQRAIDQLHTFRTAEEEPLAYPAFYPNEVKQRLQTKVAVRHRTSPLSKIIADIASQTKLHFVFDEAALEVEGLTPKTPVTCDLRDVSAQSALGLLLSPLQLTCIYQNEVLTISTLAQTQTQLQVRYYRIDDFMRNNHLAESPRVSLTKRIKKTVSPETWSDVGGPSEILPVTDTILAIYAQRTTHEMLDDFFAKLRSTMPK